MKHQHLVRGMSASRPASSAHSSRLSRQAVAELAFSSQPDSVGASISVLRCPSTRGKANTHVPRLTRCRWPSPDPALPDRWWTQLGRWCRVATAPQCRLIDASQALLLWTGISLMANCVARM
jgi:hypothetical protein